MGDICLYESLLLDPDWIHDYNRVYTDFYKAHYRILFEEAGVPDGVWMYEDLGYSNGLFCSPEVLADVDLPVLQGTGGLLPLLRPARGAAHLRHDRRRCR